MFRRKFVWFACAALLLLLLVPVGQAEGTASWYNPANGHTYTAVKLASPVTWEEARAAAEAAGGYLATPTSQAEQDFVTTAFPEIKQARWWLGAYQTPPSPETNPAADWHWVTGEPWAYTNWFPGEPNNDWGREHSGMFWHGGMWNDCVGNCGSRGYVVESDTPQSNPLKVSLMMGHVQGDPAYLRAIVEDQNGNRVANQQVTFTVLSGPDAGQTFTATTDANGYATVTYTGAAWGTDTIQATATADGVTYPSNTVSVEWRP